MRDYYKYLYLFYTDFNNWERLRVERDRSDGSRINIEHQSLGTGSKRGIVVNCSNRNGRDTICVSFVGDIQSQDVALSGQDCFDIVLDPTGPFTKFVEPVT